MSNLSTRAQAVRRTAGRKNQGGFTLIELTVVFLVIVVLSVIAVPRIQALIIENRTPTAARELQQATVRIRGSRSTSGAAPYGGVTIAELGAMMRNTSYTITGNPATAVEHPLGSGQGAATVAIAAGTLVAAGDSFVITFSEVDRAACTPLASTLQGQAEVISITPSGGAAVVVKANGGAYNAATTQTTCDDRNTIAFTFR